MSEEHEKKSALVPRLRFPEFRKAAAWTTFELGSLSQSVTERVGNTACTPYTITTGVGLVSQEEKLGRTIAGNSLKNYIVLQRDDFAYNKSATKAYPQGFIAHYVGEDRAAVPNSIFTCFRLNQNLAIPAFADKLFAMNLHGMWLRSRIAVGARAHGSLQVNDADLMALPVPLPSGSLALAEQQKIANCLSSLDELIAAEAQKLDALKTHKKGLMQQLYPAEGETLPRLRFPEFREAGEWEEKLVEEFFDVGSSKRVLQEDWTTQGVPFYRTRELVSLSKNEPFGSDIFISEELFCEISKRYGVPAVGDFLVSGVGTLGISYQVQTQDRFYFKDGNVLWFKLKGGIVSTFFKYCFEADGIQNQILSQASVSTVGTYTIQNAKVTKFTCPANIEEQQKIADCLASLDDLIAAQTQKIEQLKRHKKGLMQQLFPVLDEAPA